MKSHEPIEFLRREFAQMRAKNPAFSLRAFARRIGMSPARLSQVLNRKRHLTRGQIDKIGTAFALDSATIADFSRQSGIDLGSRRPRKTSPHAKQYADLNLDTFHFIADWHHSAILCLLATSKRKPKPTVAWIAKRLGISAIEARGAVERLVNLGLLRESEDSLEVASQNLATPSDVPSGALRHLHRQMIDLGKDALETQSVDERDITSITMAIDPEKVPAAKKMIKDFRRQLSAFLEEGSSSEVYALNVQLFQLSKPEKT